MSATDYQDLSVTYAALLLHDAGIAITSDKLQALFKAAEIEVPPFYTRLYVRVLTNRSIDDLLNRTSAAPVAAAPAAAAASAAAAPAEDKAAAKPAKEEEVEEEDMDAGGLFGDADDY